MQLKKIKRTEKKGTESVMDEKFSILFSSKFFIGNELQFEVRSCFKLTYLIKKKKLIIIYYIGSMPMFINDKMVIVQKATSYFQKNKFFVLIL